MNTIIMQILKIAATDRKDVFQKLAKLGEEVGELNKAVLLYEEAHGTEYRDVSRSEARAMVVEEIVDVVMVALSILPFVGTITDLIPMFAKKLEKWETKLRIGDNMVKNGKR